MREIQTTVAAKKSIIAFQSVVEARGKAIQNMAVSKDDTRSTISRVLLALL